MIIAVAKYLFGLTVVAFFLYTNKTVSSPVHTKLPVVYKALPLIDTPKLNEFFADSLHIGKKSLNKIELAKYEAGDSAWVTIKFFARVNSKWILKNKFLFENADIINSNPEISDFNNDGFSDFTYKSMIAARGANEVRKLFIYNKATGKLMYITNSEDYPNMFYNEELNCIDAFLVYGGCSTVFLKIKGNRLREFASVELYEGLTVKEYDEKGKEKILFHDSTNKTGFIRYRNYKPLKE